MREYLLAQISDGMSDGMIWGNLLRDLSCVSESTIKLIRSAFRSMSSSLKAEREDLKISQNRLFGFELTT